MNTIVKTGAVLLANPNTFNPYDIMLPRLARWEDGRYTIMGDLHVVGDSAVVYLPNKQIDGWSKVHGTISFDATYFYRRNDPFSTLVLPLRKVTLERSAVGELIWADWVRSGGDRGRG